MDSAKLTEMMDSMLTYREKLTFARVKRQLSETFAAAGHAVETCRASGVGDRRMIEFIQRSTGLPVVIYPAGRFVEASDDDLLGGLQFALAR